jgi:hypothetical protein
VFYRSNRYRKDNPRWGNGHAAETQQVLDITYGMRSTCGIATAWLIGLPRRAGARLHAANDAEACWQHWHVAERRGGLVRRYRDARFDLPERYQLQASVAGPDSPYPGDR